VNPAYIYFAVVAGVLLICGLAVLTHRPPVRSCPQCGAETPQDTAQCRSCGHRFMRMSQREEEGF
jgi:ribosomal protein L40E